MRNICKDFTVKCHSLFVTLFLVTTIKTQTVEVKMKLGPSLIIRPFYAEFLRILLIYEAFYITILIMVGLSYYNHRHLLLTISSSYAIQIIKLYLN